MAKRSKSTPPSATATAAVSPEIARVKRRRNPLVYVGAVALVLLGILGSLFAFNATAQTHSVVAVRNHVDRGAVLTAADLQTVQVGTDPALRSIPGNQLQQMIGKRAATELSVGTLLTRDQVAQQLTPAAGRSVVGLSLGSGQMPAKQLSPGDKVRIVPIPAQTQNGQPNTKPGNPIDATVISTTPDPGSTTNTIVNLDVSAGSAIDIAAASATSKIVLILDSRER